MTPYEPVGWGRARRSPVVRFLPAMAVIAGVVAIAFVGLGGKPGSSSGPTGRPGETPFPASPVVGVVTSVESTGLSNVTGFVLSDTSGQLYRFELGPLENAEGFPPGHLAEHQLTSEPIRVFFRMENGAAVAYRIEDASTSRAPGPRLG